MRERGEMDCLPKRAIGNAFVRRRKPGGLPGYRHIAQGEVRHPCGCAHQKRDYLALAVELSVQLGLPAGLELRRQGEGELPCESAMGRDQESGDAGLLAVRHAAFGVERPEKSAHARVLWTGMAR